MEMPNEFSYGKEAAAFTSEFIKQNFDSIYSSTKSLAQSAATKVRLRLERTYTEYFLEVGMKYSKVKTFLVNQEDVDLYEFYVPLGVSVRRTRYPDVSISDLTLTQNFHVVTGSAGNGKSMTMRHLFLDSIKHRKKVPVFLELRDLNSYEGNLEQLIVKTLADNKFDLGDEFIANAFELGHFILFLDGFDELADERREDITKEILKITKRYDQNQIIVSSRPDDFFNSWPGFRVWTIDNLTLEKACQLIDRLPFDAEIKKKFITDLREKLFDEHEYFLSNPLLLSIMWLCYSENAAIPKKLSLFYQQAYEALFNKHDAKKGGYERKRKTSLDVKDFADIFSVFAIQTFDDNKIEMSETEAIGYINKAKEVKKLSFNSQDFLRDCIKSVCLILEDGLRLRFAHRSFQEYFAAYFILNADVDVQRKLLSRYLTNRVSKDNVIQMVYSLKRDIVEQFLIIPEIQKLEKKIGYNGRITLTVFANYLTEVAASFRIFRRDREGKRSTEFETLSYQIKNTRISSLSHLVRDNPTIRKEADSHIRQMHKGRAQLVAEFKRIFGNPESTVSISDVVSNKEFLKVLMDNGYALHLKILLMTKPLLIEKYQEQKESLTDILGL
jgi:hypothetical protein